MKKRVLIVPAVLSLGLIAATTQATSATADTTAGGVQDSSQSQNQSPRQSQDGDRSQVTVPGAHNDSGAQDDSTPGDSTQSQAPRDNGDGLTAGDPSAKKPASQPTKTPDATTDDDSASADQVAKVSTSTDRSWFSGTESAEGVKVTFKGLTKGKTYYVSTAPGPSALDSTNSVTINATSASQTVTFKPHGAGIIGGVNRVYVDNPDGSRHDVGSFAVNDALAQPSFELSTTNITASELGKTGITVTGKNAVGSDAGLALSLQEHSGPDTQQRNPETMGGGSATADGSGNVNTNLKVANVTPGQYDLFVYNDAGTIVYEQVVTVTAE